MLLRAASVSCQACYARLFECCVEQYFQDKCVLDSTCGKVIMDVLSRTQKAEVPNLHLLSVYLSCRGPV